MRSRFEDSKTCDRLALALVAVFAVVATGAGLATSDRQHDVDQLVFIRTLDSMRSGEDYYDAMRNALVQKEGQPPTQLRSIRPPTLYLLLSRFPERAWRWAAGAVFAATMVLAWRLGRRRWPLGGPLAVLLAGMWMTGASSYLYLHTELWGVPLFLGALVALGRKRVGWAAALLALAAVTRELYVVPLLAGLILVRPRRPWLIALGGVAVLALIHGALASDVLAEHGYEPPFGKSGLSPSYVLSAVSPADRPFSWAVGLTGLVLGTYAAAQRAAADQVECVVLATAAVLVPATIFLGRSYWGLTCGVALACLAPDGLRLLLDGRSADLT